MAKLDLALVVRTVDKATAPLRRIQKSVREIDRSGRLRQLGRRMRSAGQAAARFAKKVGLVVAAFGALIGLPALKAFAKLESLETSFESMLGSVEAAKEMVKRLTEFSAKTPFQISGIGDTTKLLLAFGVTGDEIIDKLEFLGDIAAGTGVPLKDLAQIYGKSIGQGQGANRGIEPVVGARGSDSGCSCKACCQLRTRNFQGGCLQGCGEGTNHLQGH